VTAPAPSIARRSFIGGIAGSFATAMLPEQPLAETGFDQWIAAFRSKAIAHGIADDTYTRIMQGLHPDTTGLEAITATVIAVQNFQHKAGISPTDGYPGVRLLARLRKGS
jgi:membrane-bound lytic murein transglycosylase B